MVASYYCFDVETHSEFPGRDTLSMHEIVGGVARACVLDAKLKFFPGMFVGEKIYAHKNLPLYSMKWATKTQR